MIAARRIRSLEITDGLSFELRECVHEFGLPIVTVLMKHGVNNPRAIREVVREIWGGARQEGQRSDARGTVDWLLSQNGSTLHAKTLYRILADSSLVVTSVEPTRAMLSASMSEVSGHNIVCTKEEKHRRRLRAALRASLTTMLDFGIRGLPQQ